MATGTVFDIQRFCVDDGPGIRTTVFFKGCPLRCIWCHNAEGLSGRPQLYYSADKCVFCTACAKVCPNGAHSVGADGHSIDFLSCSACSACVSACPTEALRIAGREMSAEEIIREVLKDKAFYKNSGGGMTLSGGEPLMQGKLAAELALLAKQNGISVAIETSGYCSKGVIEQISPHTDLFLFDFKHSDPAEHKRYTGVDNACILENLEYISQMGKDIILRCPIIPGCNDTEGHYTAIASLAERLEGICEVHIEPYHPFGLGKYASVGLTPSYNVSEAMSANAAKAAAEAVQSACNKKVIIS